MNNTITERTERRPLLDAIGAITESKKKHVNVLGEARQAIADFVSAAGGEVRFTMPDDMRSRNEEAIEKAVAEAADDEETRRFLETWRGPLYGDAIRTYSRGMEWMTADGPAFGFIDAVRVDGGRIAVDVVPEDDILRHDVRRTVTVSLDGADDPKPVLEFLLYDAA